MNPQRLALTCLGLALALFLLPHSSPAQKQKPPIPHGQDRPPNDPYPPAEAVKRMKVPEGFRVEVVASEPQIVNPVAMTIDEKGRFWITESLEYPRSSAGPGKDRVKILEDTDGDGKIDKVTIFAEGLNIPSGIAVGHGGVWVANAPDILFYKIGPDGKAAGKPEVVVSGFGRTDTHELPNSLTWGPDGWLYGLNGVFNHSHVKHNGKEWKFTCALFRIHPKTREFQLFCEGTSNPWGIAFDNEGSAFVSACVIDHLWHLVETGYYHRQGGPYPPFTWKIESIVKHKHQKAAYCGLHFFDSDAYPPEYREKLYMGNIHGGCINVDVLERQGSTYFARPRPDFLTANDAWFMPVVQKTGPDGCLYILDWYDRYHCYQDARRDPQGIDRLQGRLYRVRYKDTPRVHGFDLARESDDELVKRLGSPNVYFRDLAQRLLYERSTPSIRAKLEKLVLDEQSPRKARMHALWSLVSMGPTPAFLGKLLEHRDPSLRAWGVRAAGNAGNVDADLRKKIASLARDSSPDVQLQVAIAAGKIGGLPSLPLLTEVLEHCGEDRLIPPIVWQNLHPLLENQAEEFVALLEKRNLEKSKNLSALMPRVVDRILGRQNADIAPLASLFALLARGTDQTSARRTLALLAERVQTGELTGERLAALRKKLEPTLNAVLAGKEDSPLYFDSALLAATWKDARAVAAVRKLLESASQPESARLRAFEALIAAEASGVLDLAAKMLSDPRSGSLIYRGTIVTALARLDDPKVAAVLLQAYPKLEPENQPRALETLSQRPAWSKALMQAVAEKKVPASAINVNQVRRMLASKDTELVKLVRAQWGTLREQRNPQREQVIAQMRSLIRRTPGDPKAGREIFKKVCAQCHKIYGEGVEVGPDITSNGRASFEQLLSNVFDPSLVIGASYQATNVTTKKGRIVTGLLTEDSSQRVVLKTQGGKPEIIPREQIEEISISRLSMMPEDLEKQLKPQEIVDLFAFLTLDRPPGDPKARKIPGTSEIRPRQTSDPKKFNEILAEVAPDFQVAASGEGGVALLREWCGREGVVRTHPPRQGVPCILRTAVEVPRERKTWLMLAVSHDPRGDWQLIVKANGQVLHTSLVGARTVGKDGWREISLDLSSHAGKKVQLEIHNHPNNWLYEHAYWGRVAIVSQ